MDTGWLLIFTCRFALAVRFTLDVIGRQVVWQFHHINTDRFPLNYTSCLSIISRASPPSLWKPDRLIVGNKFRSIRAVRKVASGNVSQLVSTGRLPKKKRIGKYLVWVA